MDNLLDQFESLGANCEFAFFLRDRGNNDGTLFRWAQIENQNDLIHLIKSKFVNMLQIENVVPANRDMVVDTIYNICWHTPLKSRTINDTAPATRDNLEFIAASDERLILWEQQKPKINHMINKFLHTVQNGNKIFVYKLAQGEKFDTHQAQALYSVLQISNNNRLMIAGLAGKNKSPGSVEKIADQICFAYLDRYAPMIDASSYSGECWDKICKEVVMCFEK